MANVDIVNPGSSELALRSALRALEGRYNSSVNVLDYATSESNRTAIRTGAAPINPAWDAAVAAATSLGAKHIFIPAGTYETSTDGRLDNPGFFVSGEPGLTVITKNGVNSLFRTVGTAPTVSGGLLASNAAKGDLSVTLNAGLGAGFSVGQTCVLLDEGILATGQPGKRAEFVTVQGIATDTITFWSPINMAYTTANTARLLPVTLVDGIGYRDLIVEMDDSITITASTSFQEAFAFDLRFCREPVIQSISIRRSVHAGIYLTGCLNATISDYRCKDFGSATTGSSDPASTEGTGGFGYGILERALNTGLVAKGINALRVRHGYTTGAGYASQWSYGCPIGSLITNSVHREAKEAGWDTHETGIGIKFQDVHTIGGRRGGFQIRSAQTTLTGCSARLTRAAALWIRGGETGSTHGDDCTVVDFKADTTNLYNDGSIDWREIGAVSAEAWNTTINGLTAINTGGPALTIGRNGIERRGRYSNIKAHNICQLASTKTYVVDFLNANTNANTILDGVMLHDTDANVTDIIRRGTADLPLVINNARGFGYSGSVFSSVTSDAGITVRNSDHPREHLPYVTGQTYSTWEGPTVTTVAIPAVDIIYFYPFRVYETLTFTSSLVRVVTGGAGSSIKVGIWANSTVSNRPLGAPITADNTGVTTASNNQDRAPVLSGTLRAGIYWIGVKATGTLPQMVSVPSAHQQLNSIAGSAALTANIISLADTYSNNMPTISEGAGFSNVASSGTPIIGLVSA